MTDDMTRRCNAAFQDTPEILCALRYYTFMETRRRRLEQELDAYTREQQEVFDILIRKRRFQNRITPLVADYRRRSREPRPSHSAIPSSSPSSSSHPTRSFLTARSSIPSSPDFPSHTAPPGSSMNPIDVDNLPPPLFDVAAATRSLALMRQEIDDMKVNGTCT